LQPSLNRAIDRTGLVGSYGLGRKCKSRPDEILCPASKAYALSDASFYVPEIDGLRAVAVGTVMLYHLNFNASVMRGGFVGVDILWLPASLWGLRAHR
jgi:hypothetical protein